MNFVIFKKSWSEVFQARRIDFFIDLMLSGNQIGEPFVSDFDFWCRQKNGLCWTI